jgi:cytochrome c biogenesis factor
VTTFDPLRAAEHVHGHMGWLAAIALLHPAILLRRRERRAHLSVGLATLTVTFACSLGVGIYGGYREKLRQSIFKEAPWVGYLFERKEHLAFGVLMLAWAGTLAYVGAALAQGDTRASLRRAAHWSFLVAAAIAVITAILGTIVATYKTF